ncbi:OsmC family protein [Halobacteriaceae archaeon GCM10025711]
MGTDDDLSELIGIEVNGEGISPKRMRVETGSGEILVGRDAKPLELLLTALAGCVNSAGHQVARDMDLDIDELHVSVNAAYDPAKYLGEETDARAGFEGFDVTVDVESDADAATIDEWLAAVERRCPVSDNLQDATPVRIERGDRAE